MTGYEILSELLGLSRMYVTGYTLQGVDEIIVQIESVSPAAVCPACQSLSTECRDHNEAVRVRDLPLWQRRCWVEYRPQRFTCPQCGKLFNERVAWRNVGFTYTIRYEQYVYERTRRDTIASIARDEGLSEEIVQDLFVRWAQKK